METRLVGFTHISESASVEKGFQEAQIFPVVTITWSFAQVIRHYEKARELFAPTRWYET